MLFNQCPIGCNAKLEISDIVLPEGALLRCPECRQLLSQCSEHLYNEMMKKFEDAALIDQNARAHKKRLSRILQYSKLPPTQTSILDIGCSFGVFLKLLRQHDFMVCGVETSIKAVEKCRAEGFDVKCGLLKDLKLAADSYDIITIYEVVEHLLDPRKLLQECYKILRPNGLIFISTGNTDSWTAKVLKERWDYFDLQKNGYGHISFFNPRSFTKLAATLGFEVRAIESKRVKLFNPDDPPSLVKGFLKLLQEALNPCAKFFNKGHDMLVVLRKP